MATIFYPNIFTGATGPQGPAGPTGATGPTGAAGTVSANSGATIGGPLKCAGPSPWFDVTAYGAKARTSLLTTTASTSGTAVTLAAAEDFVNGDGIVIFQAGAATSQTTPAAPTVTSPAVKGGRTINYKCVGLDALGGLTAASSAGTVPDAPAFFGEVPVLISSISQSSDVVTVTLSAPMPLLAGTPQIIISGVTGVGAHFNGTYPVGSVIDSTHFTYSLAGNAGAATLSIFGAWARLTANTFNITSITRSGTTLTVTTNVNHGFQVQNTGLNNYARTIACVQGVAQASPNFGPTNDMNGQYVILTASTNTMTLDTALSKTETGDLTGIGTFSPTVTVYEYIRVKCPQITVGSQTVAYYIYADYQNNGTFVLIGKTLPGFPGQSEFYDFGPWQGGAYANPNFPAGAPNGYVAPAYVPTSAPASAQNQMYVGTIASGGGTTSLVVTPTVPTSDSGLTIMHDESSALAQACIAATAVVGGSVYFPPAHGSYVINAPITIPSLVSVLVGGLLIVNETISTAGYSKIEAAPGVSEVAGQSFFPQANVGIGGLASPQICSLVNPLTVKGINFSGVSSASQTSLYAAGNGGYGLRVEDCCFTGGGSAAGTSVPVVVGGILGITPTVFFRNCEFIGFFNGMGNGFTSGGSSINIGPNIPLLWLRGNDDGGSPPAVTMVGANIFAGRGIYCDGTYGQAVVGSSLEYYEYQSPLTPTVMLYGTANSDASWYISRGNNDSQPGAIVGNFSAANVSTFVTLDEVVTSGGQNLITGSTIRGLVAKNVANTNLGQNTSYQEIVVGSSSSSVVVDEHGIGIVMAGPSNPPFMVQIPKVTGIAASQSAMSGTIPAGTYSISVGVIGWNGLQNRIADGTTVTVDGTHGIDVSWSASAGAQGYNVYINGQIQNSSIIKALTLTFTSIGNSGGSTQVDQTGLPLIDNTQVATPLLRLPTDVGHSVTLQAFQLNVSSSQLLGVPGTLVSILSAPGANKLIRVKSATFQYRYGTTAYTIGNADNSLNLVYHGKTTKLAGVTATGFVDQTANQVAWSDGTFTGTQADSVNLGIDLTIQGTTPALTLGDGTLEIVIEYSIVDLS